MCTLIHLGPVESSGGSWGGVTPDTGDVSTDERERVAMRPLTPQSLHRLTRGQTCQALIMVALTVSTAMRLSGARAAMPPATSSAGVLLVENLNGRMVGNRFQEPAASQGLAVADGTIRVLVRLPHIPYTSHLAPLPSARTSADWRASREGDWVRPEHRNAGSAPERRRRGTERRERYSCQQRWSLW